MQIDEMWQAALGELELSLSKASFTTWFRGVKLISIEDDQAIISVPSIFAKEWFEKKYQIEIVKTLKRLSDNQITSVIYQIGPDSENSIKAAKPKTKVSSPNNLELGTQTEAKPINTGLALKSDYSFDNFIVGPTNRLAYAASLAVAQNPGKTHNPLVIYGGVGLGKTHLVQAIGNYIKKTRPEATLLYTSCEDFANDYVQSIQRKKTDSFKKKYRSIDIFLVDDIQFLSRKEGTQEEFFHTFNTLHQNNRQIVMTSDRIPTAIPDLEDRLSSRFSWGLVADILPPNVETRLAILREKATLSPTPISPEILELIATNVQSNIRQLEGALTRVIAISQIDNQPLTLESAQQALKEFIGSSGNRKITPERILEQVANYFHLTVNDLNSPKRTKDLVYARRMAMFLIRQETSLSYPKIGQAMGGKDHSTVMHAINQMEKELGRNNELQDELGVIKKELYQTS